MTKQHTESIGIDLRGRVNSMKLAERNMLQPLFEAIINSIQAIEDAEISDGKIEIRIFRDPKLELGDSEPSIPSVQDFTVTDNGIGFNEENYISFKRAYSTHKSERGGKGIGRFLWLKAFSDVKIESIYLKDDKVFQRDFKFNLFQDDGINVSSERNVDVTSLRVTKVILYGYKEPYKSRCPKKLETIATRIIEHCLIYFLNENCPSIVLAEEEKEINLNTKFNEMTFTNSFTEQFKIKNFDFNITLLKWFEHEENTYNRVSLCADHREVEDFNINKIFPDLNGKIYEEVNKKPYLILGYVESSYFDNNVNEERTEISFSKEDEIQFGLLSKQELYTGVEPVVRKYFETEIKNCQKKKLETLHTFIGENAPQYKILGNIPGALEKIVVTEGMTEQDIDIKLYKAYQELDYESRAEVNRILQDINSDVDSTDAVRKRYLDVLHRLSALNKTKLAQYVVHRKYILELFEKSLEISENGKFGLEKTVHDIIFPTRKDSDEVFYDDQNLWLIDERLSFHTYLTSDKPLNTIAGLETTSVDRPDLLIFNNPISFVDGDEASFNSIILIEFKRPMRDRYDPEKDNPIEQVYNYVREVKRGKKVRRNGRHFPINDNTWFYTYLICDINEKIEIWASNAQLIKTFDGLGFYGYHKDLKCMIEIISFDQVLANAKKRNKILFHKLGI